MNKSIKIVVNIFLFLVIAGFGTYMVFSMLSEKICEDAINRVPATNEFVSPYKKIDSFDTASQIICFYIYENEIFAVLADRISIFDISGKHLRDFEITPNVRDIFVVNDAIYLLYPTRIELYSHEGQKTGGWEACSQNSDYCSFTITDEYVFVTDAAGKDICQYKKEGQLVRFIKSPQGFVIPSYSFDIIHINDTLYCSNPGRHKIESYTLDGTFIASFGATGMQEGAFSGCCNPTYLEKSPDGAILTSEKGNPRISCYGKDGVFHTVLFDSKMLGGGTAAYRMRVRNEKIYIAGRKTISIFSKK